MLDYKGITVEYEPRKSRRNWAVIRWHLVAGKEPMRGGAEFYKTKKKAMARRDWLVSHLPDFPVCNC